ncbi:MAG: 5-(carboxyamino)imidazole ribonucleotide mutase [Streptococcaceae bacterium]|jgi:5-(carboxyamino)imidazole ribonucleotide mutase|nr:5-(carboxyamino)imidazole ribonucleotide mutase [Streptococcaceae bacterium]
MVDVAIMMGSISDWATMQETAKLLDEFGVSYTKNVVSAHRTPEKMADFAKNAKAAGYKVIIAGAGGAAHLPGMTAAQTILPVIGVPIKTSTLSGVDSLYSIVQMPAGVPVATMAIGVAGAKNAALYAVQMLAVNDKNLARKIEDYRAKAEAQVAASEEDLV